MSGELGHPPLSAVVFDTSASFALVALMAIEPVASGVGRFGAALVPAASCTR
jgi:hypothetical protein